MKERYRIEERYRIGITGGMEERYRIEKRYRIEITGDMKERYRMQERYRIGITGGMEGRYQMEEKYRMEITRAWKEGTGWEYRVDRSEECKNKIGTVYIEPRKKEQWTPNNQYSSSQLNNIYSTFLLNKSMANKMR